MTEPLAFMQAAEVSMAALPAENRSLLSVEVRIVERTSTGEQKVHELAWPQVQS